MNGKRLLTSYIRPVLVLLAVALVGCLLDSAPPAAAQPLRCGPTQTCFDTGVLGLGGLVRTRVTNPNEVHRYRLDLPVATNLLLKLYVPTGDYDLVLRDASQQDLGGGLREEDVDPYIMRYLPSGTYYVIVQGPRQNVPDEPYILYAAELGRSSAPGVRAGPITADDVNNLRTVSLLNLRGEITHLAFSPDAKFLAATSNAFSVKEAFGGTGLLDERAVKVWDLTEGREVRTLHGGGTADVRGLAFSPDGRFIAVGWGNNAAMWALPGFNEVRKFRDHTQQINAVAFSPDGKILATASQDNTIKLWDVETGGVFWTLSGHTAPVTSVAFAANGKLIASGSEDGTVRLFDVATGAQMAVLTGHQQTVSGVAFAPDSSEVASSSYDGTVKLWDVAAAREIATLAGSVRANAVEFSPDGKLLVSTHSPAPNDTGTIRPEQSGTVDRVWDVATHQVVGTLGPIYPDVAVAFSADGRMIATGGGDRVVAIWGVEGQPTTRDRSASEPYVLRTDSFRSSFGDYENSQLQDGSNGLGAQDHENGEYVIRTPEGTDSLVTAAVSGTYSDAGIAVDARLEGDPSNQLIEVACRRQGDNQEYRLAVSPADGTFKLSVWNGSEADLAPFQASPAINVGNATNRLQLTCADDFISAQVNGEDVASVQDDTFGTGSMWLGVSGSGAAAFFDNLVVTLQ